MYRKRNPMVPWLLRTRQSVSRRNDISHTTLKVKWWFSRLFCLRTDFEYNEQHFVVWNMPLPQSTLSSVIADPELWPLPRRHIKEIALQIADAVQSKLRSSIYLVLRQILLWRSPRTGSNCGRFVAWTYRIHRSFGHTGALLWLFQIWVRNEGEYVISHDIILYW